LGRGGMGEVYEAEDTRKHRIVALKLISHQFSTDATFRARMQREADTAGRLTEPHIVPIHDYGDIDGQFYVEMRMIDGVSLRTLLTHYGPLPAARTVAIVRQIAAALDAAHACGITHRDVKPENILITGEDFAYLVDFGIARAATDPGLTQGGFALGTYNYMAPERFTGDEVTYRSDIYALAAVLGECLTGAPPFSADSVERLIAAHLLEPAPQPSQLRPGRVPPALDAVIGKGMAKVPAERYCTAGDLAVAAHDALSVRQRHQEETVLRDANYPTAATMARVMPRGIGGVRTRPPAPSPARRPGRKRTRWILAGTAVLLIVAVALTGYLGTRPSSASRQQASGQTELPFNGINFRLSPGGITLDKAGDVYVTSEGMYGRVVELTPGSSTPTVLPFNGLYQPQGLAVDGSGAVYVADFNNRVVKLAAGSNSQTVLPFAGLNYPEGVAVDAQGNVYVADRGNNRVLKLAAGSNSATALPFTGLKNPDGVAVDPAGNVYVTDTDNNRVLMLPAGSSGQTVLPFNGVAAPWGIAVNNAGDVFVTEHDGNQVVKLPAGSNTATVLPFTGLNTPLGVAIDKDQNAYVADRGNDRVVKLTT
jgi:serine/threonine-protein kinase